MSEVNSVLPAHWLLKLTGFIPKNSKELMINDCADKCCPTGVSVKSLLCKAVLGIFLLAAFLWFIMFSVCTFTYELNTFEKGKQTGAEKESEIIIRILDNIPWSAIMLRNIAIITVFCHRYRRLAEVTNHLATLLKIFIADSNSLYEMVKYSWTMLVFSWVIVTANFVMVLMYYFNADFSDLYGNHFDFAPMPFVLNGWQVMVCLFIFTWLPFLMGQVVLTSLVGLAVGGRRLLIHLNANLVQLGKTPLLRPVVGYPDCGEKKSLAVCREIHFKILMYIADITSAFSLIFLIATAADFTAAVGYVGLLIGRKTRDGTVNQYFSRAYHAIATVTWMGFFLCTQYWPILMLPEEAEKTHHFVERLSFIPEFKAESPELVAQKKKSEREILHFLLATKDTFVGIVAGKILYFSRHLSITMITLLCSYGVLVYELLHRDRTMGLTAGNATDPSVFSH